MSRKSDEQYLFEQDSREKKNVARGARHTRTHCGKGGAVKFPSDYLSAKERKAMNGKVETYRMNSPISWKEFKSWPDEHKITYIKLLRQRYNVPDNALAEMMGASKSTLCALLDKVGLTKGAGHGARNWDKEAFYIWSGKSIVTDEDLIKDGTDLDTIETDTVLTKDDIEKITVKDDLPEPDFTYNTLVPEVGEMVFEGKIDDILRTVSILLNGAKVHLSIKWDVIEDRDAIDPEIAKVNLKKGVVAGTYALMNEERKKALGTKG